MKVWENDTFMLGFTALNPGQRMPIPDFFEPVDRWGGAGLLRMDMPLCPVMASVVHQLGV
jgi:hypothetical protein